MEGKCDEFPPVVELNIGGVFYSTSLACLTSDPNSLLGQIFTGKQKGMVVRDNKGKYFLDRDGVLFRYILDYLRNKSLTLPENFHEVRRLKQEAEYFKLPEMMKSIRLGKSNSSQANHTSTTSTDAPYTSSEAGYITLGYRGTFAFGRDGLADVKFRKISRILVHGRVSICRDAFGDTLNENRDPDRGMNDRYTARFYLKHTFLEQAFDMLQDAGFRMVTSCGSGTNSAGDIKPGMDSEEAKWNHYNEFVFCRP